MRSEESMLWAIPSVFAATSKKNNLIEKRKHSFHDLRRGKNTLTLYDMQGINTLIKAIDSVGDPPLPIPNREVKPDSADGTAKICGRVGHRHFYKEQEFKRLLLSFYTGSDNLLSWWCRLSATRTGMNSVHAACDLLLPAPTNSTSFRLWESRSSPLL